MCFICIWISAITTKKVLLWCTLREGNIFFSIFWSNFIVINKNKRVATRLNREVQELIVHFFDTIALAWTKRDLTHQFLFLCTVCIVFLHKWVTQWDTKNSLWHFSIFYRINTYRALGAIEWMKLNAAKRINESNFLFSNDNNSNNNIFWKEKCVLLIATYFCDIALCVVEQWGRMIRVRVIIAFLKFRCSTIVSLSSGKPILRIFPNKF